MSLNYELLYWLQSVREAFGETGIVIMDFISQNAIVGMAPLVAFVYWCVNKRFGQTAFLSYAGTSMVNQFIKLTFCIERPWIIDSRIKPPEIAIRDQGGYSFPSGHIAIAISTLGSLLIFFKKRYLSIVGWVVIAVTALSRCYLGVHTPLDVIAGCVEALAVTFVADKVCRIYWDDRKKTFCFMLSSLALAAFSALYFRFKPYPIHYDSLGNMITDPKTMITYSGVALFAGTAVGIWFENRFIHFSTDITMRQRIQRAICGAAVYLPLLLIGNKLTSIVLSGDIGSTVASFFAGVYIMAIFPAAFKYIDRIGAKKHEAT